MVVDLATDRDQDRLVVLDRADDVLAGDVVGGDDDDLRPVERRIELEGVEGARARRSSGSSRRTRRRERRCRPCRARAGELGRALAAQRHGRAGAARDRRAGGMTSASGTDVRVVMPATIPSRPGHPTRTAPDRCRPHRTTPRPVSSSTGNWRQRVDTDPTAAGARIIRARRRRWRARTMRGAAGG